MTYFVRGFKDFLQTRDVDGGSRINNATIWAYTVSAWRRGLDFKTDFSFCGVGELQISSDNICKGPWESHRETVWWLRVNLDKNIPPYIQISPAGILSRHNAVTMLTKQYSFQLSSTIVRWENIHIK